MLDDPIDRFFQYYGEPILQLRSKLPLPTLPRIVKQHQASQQIGEELPETPQIASSESKQEEDTPTSGASDTQSRKLETELAIASEPQLPAETNDLSAFYPLQEYRYSPDLYLGITRERTHGAVIPGKDEYCVRLRSPISLSLFYIIIEIYRFRFLA